jgi:hypothetical protein
MQYVLIDITTGLPECVIESGAYYDGLEAYGKLYKELPNSIDKDIILDNYHWKSGNFKTHLKKPSKYHTWDLEAEAWIEPENYQQLLFDEAASKVKQKRQRLLTATDWTDTVSASTRLENYNAWQFYRQALRDITTQEGYPFNVIWPTQPV